MDIRIFNLSVHVIESDLIRIFSRYGPVDSVVITRSKSTGRSTGCAFISMANNELARQAIVNLDQTLIDGQRIAVSEIKFSLGKFNN
jgi:RNA recognition motif-containing protein